MEDDFRRSFAVDLFTLMNFISCWRESLEISCSCVRRYFARAASINGDRMKTAGQPYAVGVSENGGRESIKVYCHFARFRYFLPFSLAPLNPAMRACSFSRPRRMETIGIKAQGLVQIEKKEIRVFGIAAFQRTENVTFFS